MKELYVEIHKYDNIMVQNFIGNNHTTRQSIGLEQALKTKHNHRKIAINEVVFDIDCHMEDLSRDIEQFISNSLIKDDISHSVWHTSRSYHIHAFFHLAEYDQDTRKALRKFLLKHYSKQYNIWLDMSKSSENVMIRDFNGLHEQTGKPKTLIYHGCMNKPILNPIKAPILNDFWQGYKSPNLNPIVKISPTASGLNPNLKDSLTQFITQAQTKVFSKSGMQKNNLYFKNIAIAAFLLGIPQTEATEIFKKVCANCKPHKIDNLENWLKWCKQQKHQLKVNWKEVELFYGNS